MMSLNRRMLLGASLVLAVFVVLATLALDRAFYESARSARQERLLGQVYLLIAAAEVGRDGQLSMPPALSEARFNLPGSGLYGHISDGKGTALWRSPSALGIQTPTPAVLAAGEKRFDTTPEFFVQHIGVNWAVGQQHFAFSFSVSEDQTGFNAQISHYRQSLWGWLAALSIVLLLAQAILLRWGLKPLRQVARELNAVETGQQAQLQGSYPAEIKRLTAHLNAFIQQERTQQERYRNALGDLAHSLKTPLAVMRGALPGDAKQLAATVEEQVARMDSIVAYQLQRAATAGRTNPLATPVALLPLVNKIAAALGKVHRDKGIHMEIAITPEMAFTGDEGDLLELLGNLMDNACKWCRHTVKISATANSEQLTLTVEDDGPGIDPAQVKNILQRGVRADEAVPGHGIGLAVARDIAQAYQGKIEAGRSTLGGALFLVELPVRQ